MGLFSKLFSKKDVIEKSKEMMNHEEAEKIANEIYERLKEHTEVSIVKFDLKKERVGILESKIGGAFYVPEEMEIPQNKETGNPLYLLAQLNFAQIPHLEEFPEKGLLQIFIAGDDDTYGCDFDDDASQDKWCVRFIEEFPETIPEKCIYETAWDEETMLPFEQESQYKLVAELDKQVITSCDYRFEECMEKYCQGIIEAEPITMADIDDKVMEVLWSELSVNACYLGGYPWFTQSDPRELMENEKNGEVLLFQLDTVEDIMWGDGGVGNFFISKEALRNRDFSNVYYNWDCY